MAPKVQSHVTNKLLRHMFVFALSEMALSDILRLDRRGADDGGLEEKNNFM